MAKEEGANEHSLEWSEASSDMSSLHSPSSDDDFSDDEYEYLNEWTETPLHAKDIRISIDSVGMTLVNNYSEEKTQIKAWLRNEVKSIRTLHNTFEVEEIADDASLSANEIFNSFFSPTIAFELHGVMNRGLQLQNEPALNQEEFQSILRMVFYFCYYEKGPSEVCSHPENFPEAAALVALLQGSNDSQQKKRLLALLRSMEGDGGTNQKDVSMTWSSVFDIDDSLENLF